MGFPFQLSLKVGQSEPKILRLFWLQQEERGCTDFCRSPLLSAVNLSCLQITSSFFLIFLKWCLRGWDKSWVSFEKFRKFPIQWAQKLCIFTQNCLRYKGSKLATLIIKYCIWASKSTVIKLSLCPIIIPWLAFLSVY